VRLLVHRNEGLLMQRDFYNDAFELAHQTRDAGHPDWAVRLEDTIESGSTATEILMGLRWVLGELLSAVTDLPPETRGLADDLRASIGNLLGQP
jgi:hypothetical protein